MIILPLLVLCILVVSSLACPPWTYSNSDGECQCGNSLEGVVHCDSVTLNVSVLSCNCMTLNKSNKTVVGKCLAMCKVDHHACSLYNIVGTNQVGELDTEACDNLNRTGQLCGDCIDGHGPPVYSYSLPCVKCNEPNSILKYSAIAFLPLTLFYSLTILRKVSVTSPEMISFVFVSQIYSVPKVMKAITTPNTRASIYIKLVIAFFSLWNLDIFRSVYTPFCLHPKLNTMQVTALDYLVAVYPMFLIFLTYIAVTLHDRYPIKCNALQLGCRVRAWLGIRSEWNIRGSLIQAFATFLVLSYVKILNISVDLLSPVYVYSMDGSYNVYLFNDGEISYFGRDHRPYGLLALLMLVVFNIMPILLLLVYPCRCFQSKLNSRVLTTFMDAFQGCYRHHPKDCRYFSAVHFIFRILILLALTITEDRTFTALVGLLFILLTALVTIIRPYKNMFFNKLEGFIYMVSALLYFTLFTSLCLIRLAKPKLADFKPILTVPFNILIFFPVAFGTIVLVYIIFPLNMIKKCASVCSRSLCNR